MNACFTPVDQLRISAALLNASLTLRVIADIAKSDESTSEDKQQLLDAITKIATENAEAIDKVVSRTK